MTPSAAIQLAKLDQHTAWRVDWSIPRDTTERLVEYRLGSDAYVYTVPATNQALRLAYASCNGFSDPIHMKHVDDVNERWGDMRRRHEDAPLHLLLMGGDQVYGDELWQRSDELAEWLALPRKQREDEPAEPYTKHLDKFYFGLYGKRWAQKAPAAVFARVPSLMMWDDHDIFDGWGSYPDATQASRVYQAIFQEARKAFRAFQLRVGPSESIPGAVGGVNFTYGFVIDDLAILALDLRSERSLDQVMSPAGWDAVYAWLETLSKGAIKHLFVLSSIPVVYPRFSLVEKVLGAIPGQQDLEDDLKDHWTTRTHREERLRLVHRLFAFAASRECRVTIVSGDVHVAALGALFSTRDSGAEAVINQLVSSGIVHTPPPSVACFYVEQCTTQEEYVDRGITARMLPFAGTDQCFVGRRNWLSLDVEEDRRVWASWWAEGEKHPFRKVIHPV